MNTPTDSDKPKLRMWAYELTHPTDTTRNGYFFTFRCAHRETADAMADKFAKARDCGWRRKECLCC